MRSQVTRHAFRRLAQSRPSGAFLPLLIHPRPTFRVYPVGSRVFRVSQRRSFIEAFFKKPPRVLKELETEPGYETLLALTAAESSGGRPPEAPELIKAWKEFFAYKARHKRVVNSTQALSASQVFDYLNQTKSGVADEGGLTEDDLRIARDCLLRPPRDNDFSGHLKLSEGLYRELRHRVSGIRREYFPMYKSEAGLDPSKWRIYAKDVGKLLDAYGLYGKAVEARQVLLEYHEKLGAKPPPSAARNGQMNSVLRGLALEGREGDIRDLTTRFDDLGIEYTKEIHHVITAFFAQNNNIAETKRWFQEPIKGNEPPLASTYSEVLRFALRNNETVWATHMHQRLVKNLDTTWHTFKRCWDVSFQWELFLKGRGTDHLEAMLRSARDATRDNPGCSPDVGSINGLLAMAVENNDPYLAERLVMLSERMGIEASVGTYILQLRYRLQANDLDGAFNAYQNIRNQDENYTDREMPALNEFIRSMCVATAPDHERILDVTSYLEQRHATLEPETVVSLCLAFLRHDEMYEVIDTLSLHTAHYSIPERHTVHEAFVQYCLDKSISTARVWDAYSLLRQFFPEVAPRSRVLIMDTFFDRRRADMASHVFGHMRAHGSSIHRPTLSTYVQFFEGIGRAPDLESLRMVHNMLKMDTTIQPDTLLLTSLMIGYTACDEPYRALELWREITSSPEGPTYATLEIAFRAYEISHEGDIMAKELWEKIQKMDIEVPTRVYEAYAVTMAAHSHNKDVRTLLEEMEEVVGKRPGRNTIAYAFNALPSAAMKKEFEAWAETEFRAPWESLKKGNPQRSREDKQIIRFRVARPWKAS